MRQRIGEVVRFGFVGVLNTLVDFGVFFLAVMVGVPRWWAQVLGYASGTVNSFFWNKKFTFRHEGSIFIGMVVRFLFVNGVSLGLSVAVIVMLPQLGMELWLAKIFASLTSLAVNYVGYKWFVFQRV